MSGATAKPRSGLAAYAVVTAAYWTYMLTDGALRMLVLLHFHVLGFHPIELAYLFLLYEFMGVVTNLSAGWRTMRRLIQSHPASKIAPATTAGDPKPCSGDTR